MRTPHTVHQLEDSAVSRWAAVPRLLHQYLKLRGIGRSLMFIATYQRGLQLLPVRMRDGRILHLDLREPVCLPYLLTGWDPYEHKEPELLRTLIRQGDTVVDIGANIGWYSSLLGELVGPNGRVYAFEPSKIALRMLYPTAERYRQLTVCAEALGARDGETQLYLPDNIGNASLHPPSETCSIQSSPLTTLDGSLPEASLSGLSFVKCDVEGAELGVLAGAKKLLGTRHPPVWMVEMNETAAARFGHHPREIIKIFETYEEAHYSAYRFDSVSGDLKEVFFDGQVFNAILVPGWKRDWIESWQRRARSV